MKLLIFSLALFIGIGAASTWARLGETRKECIGRYGDPVETNETELVFHRNAITITVKFDAKDHSEELRFRGAPLEHWQAAHELVHRNLGSADEKQNGPNQRSWYATDGSSFAHWMPGSLIVRSADRNSMPESDRKLAHENAEHWKAHQKSILEKIEGF